MVPFAVIRHVLGQTLLFAIVVSCSLLVAGTPARGQDGPPTKAYVDSLYRVLKRTPPDTSRLHLLERMVEVVRRDVPQAARLAVEGRPLAHRLGDRRSEGYFDYVLATNARDRQDFVSATRYYRQALQATEASLRLEPAPANDYHPRELTMARAENGLGDLAGMEGDYVAAEQHCRRALPWVLALPANYGKRQLLLVFTYSNLTIINTFRVKTEHPADAPLANVHRYAAATRQAARAVQASGDKNYLLYLANVWCCESDLLMLAGKSDSAIALNQRAAAAYKQIGAVPEYAAVQQHLLDQHNTAGHYAQALAIVREIQPLFCKAEGGVGETDFLETKAFTLSKVGDWRGAYEAAARASVLRDSLLSTEKRNAIAELEVRFETERKESQIRELSQRARLARADADRQRQQLWALVAVLGAVLAGAAVGAFLFGRLRRSQRRLTHLTELKDQLFAIIGHDLRAPVASFRQVAPLLYTFAHHPDPAEQTELAQAFDRTSADLAALLDNLLDWGRVQTRALAVRPELTDLAQLLATEAQLVTPTATAKQLTVTVEAADALSLVATDPTLLRVVVRNLITNALKYTQPGGTITLFAEATPGGATTVGVRDTGLGMTADRLQQILGDAPRTSTRGTAGETGTGLGLRVATAFARELGALLSGQSTVGQGTTFRLALSPLPVAMG